MGGARTVNRQRNVDPTRTFDSICILDGDQSADPSHNVFVLPGDTYPENYVFDFVLSNIDDLAAKLTVMLGLRVEQQESVKEAVRKRALTNADRHMIFEQVGEDLGFLAGLVVKNSFLTLWAQSGQNGREMVAPFLDRLPVHS
jgi:hypothetical protein